MKLKKHLKLILFSLFAVLKEPKALFWGLIFLFRNGPVNFWQRVKAIKKEAEPPEILYNREVKKWLNHPRRLADLNSRLAKLNDRPLISLVVPVYNPPFFILKEMIDSVKNQIYPKWELCLADGGDDPKVSAYLKCLQARDPRIKVKKLKKNLGISGNLNQAIALASADFIAFLDHDDELDIEALLAVAEVIVAQPELDLIYSDEDHLDLKGNYFTPFYKPDWSPDLLLAINYINHLTVCRKSSVEKVGGLRPQFDGSQDWDLLLRLTEQTDRIYHIPKILYHWKKAPASTLVDPDLKPYSLIAGRAALTEAITRRNLSAVLANPPATPPYHMRYRLHPDILISIIIPTKNNQLVLEQCLESIINMTRNPNYEIIIVENGFAENSKLEKFYQELLVHFPEKIKVLAWQKEFNYSAINNFAAAAASGEVLVFLNDDTRVITSDWLDALAEQACRPEVGAVGAKLLYPDNTVQHGGVLILADGQVHHAFRFQSDDGYFSLLKTIRNVSAVTGACLAIRANLFESLSGFSETYRVEYSDIDLCFRALEKNYLNVYTPLATLFHLESFTRGKKLHPADAKLFYDKWATKLKRPDPYYNPNLSQRGDRTFQLSVLEEK